MGSRLSSLIDALFRRDRLEKRMDHEMRFHLEAYTEDLVRSGVPRAEAERRARIEFGGVEIAQEDCRQARGLQHFDELRQDFRYAIRMLTNAPAFAAAVVLTLALGIGANTVIFSIVDAVLLRPLPYAQPDRLVTIWGAAPDNSPTFTSWDLPGLQEWRNQKQLFEQVEAYAIRSFTLSDGGEPQDVTGAAISANLLPMLGVQPRLGRLFLEADISRGDNRVALISDNLWRESYGADPNVLGKTIVLSDQSYTILGVMPPQFAFPYKQFKLWTPLSQNPTTEAERQQRVEVIARLRPGLVFAAAQVGIKTVGQTLDKEKPTSGGWSAGVHSLDERRVNPGPRRAIYMLLIAVGFVLLIACANAANLLLARATARNKELAIRAALGAGRRRLIQQLLTESAILSWLGGAGGVLLALLCVAVIARLTPKELTFLSVNDITVDTRVLLFTLALSCVTGILCGLAPAIRVSRPDLNQSMKVITQGGTTSRAHNRVRHALVIAEIGLSFVLLIGAGLMVRSFLILSNVSPGFDPNNLVTLQLSLPRRHYPSLANQQDFFNQLKQRLAALPGVEGIAMATAVPPTTSGFHFGVEPETEGRAPRKLGSNDFLPFTNVDGSYFQIMRIPLLRGRSFNDQQDVATAPPVIIINDVLAHFLWPNDDPVGKRMRFDRNGRWFTVVGVAGDVKAMGLSDEHGAMEYYSPISQEKNPGGQKTMIVRTAGDPNLLIAEVKNQVRAIDKNQPIKLASTEAELLRESLSGPRFYLFLMAIFAGSAVLLAAIGIYGVMSYSVSQRRQEIGVRMALGARPSDVLRLIIGQGMALMLIGLALGLGAALALTRLIVTLLFGISATDPSTFVGIGALLATVALLACYIPARKAASIDPMTALRCE